MSDLVQTFDEELWRWTMTTGQAAGPGGVASAEVAGGVRVHVDALDGRLLVVDVDADDAAGSVSVSAEQTLRSLGMDPPRNGATVLLAPGVEEQVARFAVLRSEQELASALGPTSDAWEAEADQLLHGLGLSDSQVPRSPDGGAGDLAPALLDRARNALRHQHVVQGEVAEAGPVLVDPSWIPGGLLDLRAMTTEARPGSSEVVVRCGVRQGVYAAAVTGITAALVEESTGIVVGVAPFGFELVDARPGASARVLVGPGRRASSLWLWLTADMSNLPTRELRTARRATHLARVAAKAQRIGLVDEAAGLLDRATSEWSSLGRSFPDARTMSWDAFAGEVLDLVDLDPSDR